MTQQLHAQEACDYDKLLAVPNLAPIVSIKVTLASGEAARKRGTILTMDASTGKVKAVTAKTQEVYGILAEDCDASDADVETVAYANGDFNTEALIVGSVSDSSTAADYAVSARKVAIFFR